jgi:hypothetical protein
VDSPRIRFVKWLEDMGEETKRGASNEDIILNLLPKLREVAREDGFFDFSVPDSAYDDATFLAANVADLVIQGHTHSAKAYEVGPGLYLNTGTWARLLQLPGGEAPHEEWREFLLGLAEGADSGAPRPTFVRVKQEEGRTSASLLRWMDGTASLVSEWVSHPDARAWARR